MAAAVAEVDAIGARLVSGNAQAATATTSVLSAGADEVSTAIASLFSGHGQLYQRLSAQVALFHDDFVRALNAAQASYAAAEAANTSPLSAGAATPLASIEQTLLDIINAPTEAILKRPLIGDGADAAPEAGQKAARAAS